MNRILLLLITLFSAVSCIAQPISQRTNGTFTVNDPRLMAGKNLFTPRYIDTTAANVDKGIDSCGAIIFTYSTNGFWVRGCSPKKWIKVVDASTPAISGDNAITVTGNNIQFGGTPLLHNTDVDLDGYILNYLGDAGSFNVDLGNAATNTVSLALSPVSAIMSVGPPGGGADKLLRLNIDEDGIVVKDNVTAIGMLYDADYYTNGSTNDRWIPDIAAVRQEITANSVNIYNSDGTFQSDRFIDADGHFFFISNILQSLIQGTGQQVIEASSGGSVGRIKATQTEVSLFNSVGVNNHSLSVFPTRVVISSTTPSAANLVVPNLYGAATANGALNIGSTSNPTKGRVNILDSLKLLTFGTSIAGKMLVLGTDSVARAFSASSGSLIWTGFQGSPRTDKNRFSVDTSIVSPKLGINITGTGNPAYTLDVNGDAHFTGVVLTDALDNYATDLSGSYTNRSKVDKAYVLAQIAGISTANIYNSDGTLTGNRTVEMGDRVLTFERSTSVTYPHSYLYSDNASFDSYLEYGSTGRFSEIVNVVGNTETNTFANLHGQAPGGKVSNITTYADGRIDLFSQKTGASSRIDMWPDSISLLPHLGKLNIDSLRNDVGTKSLRYNPATGIVSYADTTAITVSNLQAVTTAGNTTTNNITITTDGNTTPQLTFIPATITGNNVDLALDNSDGHFYFKQQSGTTNYVFDNTIVTPSITGSMSTGGSLFLSSNLANDGTIGFGNNSIYDEATTSWGIGTVSPSYTLDVIGEGSFTTNPGTSPQLRLFDNIDNQVFTITNSGGDGLVSFDNDLGAAYHFDENILTPTNIGIGITSPTNRLHIVSTSGLDQGLTIENSGTGGTSTPAIKLISSGGDYATMFMTNAAAASPSLTGFYTQSANGFSILSSGGTRIFNVLQNGNIGIGLSTSPANLLVAQQSYSGGAVTIEAKNTSTGSGGTYAGFDVSNSATTGRMFKTGTGYSTYKTLTASDLGFYNGGAGNISILNDYSGGKVLLTAGASSTPHIVIATDGKVGIGTATPSTTLTVQSGTVSPTINFNDTNTGTNFIISNDIGGAGFITFTNNDNQDYTFDNDIMIEGVSNGLSADYLSATTMVSGATGSFTTVQSPTVRGSNTGSGNLTLQSTGNATKGKILFGTSAYDEVNNRLGIKNTSPTYEVDITGRARITDSVRLTITPSGTSVSDSILYKKTTTNVVGAVAINDLAPVVLAKGTVSSVATLDIDMSAYYTLYDYIEIKIISARPATDAAILYCRLSPDAVTYTATGYKWNNNAVVGASVVGVDDGSAANTTAIQLTGTCSSTTERTVNGTVTVFNPGSATFFPEITFMMGRYNNSPAVASGQGTGLITTAQVTRAVRLLFSSGNISTLTYKVIGYKN